MIRDRMRCVVERGNGEWQAYCVDVDLSTRGGTAREARVALDRMLERYCYELDEGVASARALRTAPVTRRLRYVLARLCARKAEAERDAAALAWYTFAAPPQLLVGLA